MKIAAKVASALSFAHLAGIGRKPSATARSEDDDDKEKAEGDDKDDDADKKGSRAEGDDKDKPEDDDKKSKAGADDDYDAEGDDTDKEDEDKKSKKSKASDDDKKEDDPDEEMSAYSPKEKAAWQASQARCAAIFASNHAARNPVLAANLAFKTRMSRKEALALLEATPTGAAAPGNTSRASRNPTVGAGGGTELSSKQKVDASWDAAFKKVNPQRR